MYDDEDDQLLLNPISLINQYELEKENNQENLKENLNVNTFEEHKSMEVNCDNIDTSFHKARASLNSTVNTNYAVDNGFNQNDINFNISFSFGQKQKNNRRNELTQESIEILHEFISNEEKIKEINRINDDVNKIERIKKGDMKIEIKMNLDKIEKNINIYFKRPFMRKNYENDKILKNIINEDVKEDKKINISDEIKKNDVTNEININNYNEI
jgi:hypothetical protein